jgi:hypothetical protein
MFDVRITGDGSREFVSNAKMVGLGWGYLEVEAVQIGDELMVIQLVINSL